MVSLNTVLMAGAKACAPPRSPGPGLACPGLTDTSHLLTPPGAASCAKWHLKKNHDNTTCADSKSAELFHCVVVIYEKHSELPTWTMLSKDQ